MSEESKSRSQLITVNQDETSGLRILRTEELLQGESEILIEHAGLIYHLRVTRAGKLILTK